MIDICVHIIIRHTLPFSLSCSPRRVSLLQACMHAHTQSHLYFIHNLIYLFPRNHRLIGITLVKFFFSFFFFCSFGVIERNALPEISWWSSLTRLLESNCYEPATSCKNRISYIICATSSVVRADSPHTNNIFICVILNIIHPLAFIGHSPIMSRDTTTIGMIY